MSYPSSLRLPKTYEQLVKDHQEIKISQLPTTPSVVLELLSNDIEPINDDAFSVGSGATEGPENDRHESAFMDKDMDSDTELFDAHEAPVRIQMQTFIRIIWITFSPLTFFYSFDRITSTWKDKPLENFCKILNYLSLALVTYVVL